MPYFSPFPLDKLRDIASVLCMGRNKWRMTVSSLANHVAATLGHEGLGLARFLLPMTVPIRFRASLSQ